MNRLLVAAVSGLLCIAASGEAVAAASAAPTEAAPASPLPRDQYLPKLQRFYTTGKALYDDSRSDKLTDQDVDQRFDAFMKWANEAGNWMTGAISPAATAQFTTWHAEFGTPYKLAGAHPQTANNKFSTLNIVLPQLLENLRVMMASGVVDPQKTGTERSK